jgi:formiminotetrahydrofolate cyclodeaminase
MEYKKQSLTKYLEHLSARTPIPGGGSAAALNAALGAALVSMVVNFTLGKPRYAKFERELKGVLDKFEKLREDFLGLVDLDVLAYKSGDPRKALDVPLMLSRLCCEAAKLCPLLVKKGNVNLISDVGVAAVFFESAFAAACFNVQINLKAMKQDAFARKVNKELNQKRKLIEKARRETEAGVGKIIRG